MRMVGSIGLGAAVRSVFLLSEDQEEDHQQPNQGRKDHPDRPVMLTDHRKDSAHQRREPTNDHKQSGASQPPIAKEGTGESCPERTANQ